jgi:hypothetical protein
MATILTKLAVARGIEMPCRLILKHCNTLDIMLTLMIMTAFDHDGF